MNEDEDSFFKAMKFQDMIRPFKKFVVYDSYVIVHHGNILSCYDTDLEEWIDHINFEESSETIDQS